MIKRYILHVEFHRGYRPRISIKRAPRHGDRVVDGGVLGTLERCPTCQDGLLHEPDPDLITTSVEETDRGLEVRLRRSDHTPQFAMDFNAKVEDLVSSPETLALDYTLGTRDYKPGEVVWTRQAEYVVEGIHDKTLYLIRKDVWESRNRVGEPLSEYEMKIRRGDFE